MKPGKPLQRRTPLKRGKGLKRTPIKRTSAPVRSTGTTLTRKAAPKPRKAISECSPEQKAKVREAVSIISQQGPCDPAHVVPRAQTNGCTSALCVVPLTREEHRAYDAGGLDLLPHLVRAGRVAELQHALGHVDGRLLELVRRTTNTRYVPEATP